MSMPMFYPGQRLPEEQDYVQAYENVREKYKGNNTPAPHFFIGFYCACSDDNHGESVFEWEVGVWVTAWLSECGIMYPWMTYRH